jgi:hypothetical protein
MASTDLLLIFFIGTISCLEMTSTEGVILPSIESKGQLVDMMVQMKIENDDNTIGGFVGQLKEMLDKLVKAQAKHEKVHGVMMKQCLEEGIFRKNEIKAGKTARAKSVAQRAKCQASLKQAQKELPGLVDSFDSYTRELKRAQKIRDIEEAKYLKRKQEFSEALAFLTDFIAYVNTKLANYNNSSFVELSSGLLKHSNKLNLLTEAAPVLASIAMETIAQKGNYEFKANMDLKSRLVTLLDNLLAKIKADNKSNDEDEVRAAGIFATYKNRLMKVINTLSINIKRVQKQIKEMTRCVATEGAIIAKATFKITRNEKLLKNAVNMCGSFNQEFITATYNRIDEIKTMQEILTIVGKRFKDLPEGLVNYLVTVKDGWIAYTNSTEFNKFKEYERQKQIVNQRGMLLAKENADKDLNPERAVVKGKNGIY